jgi:cytochrome c
MKKILIAIAALAGLCAGNAVHAADAAKAKQLAQKYNCLACHAEDKKLVGPSYKDVAKKYKGDAGAEAKLMEKVRKGGAKVWGPVPMPENTKVSDADLKTIVAYILTLAK